MLNLWIKRCFLAEIVPSLSRVKSEGDFAKKLRKTTGKRIVLEDPLLFINAVCHFGGKNFRSKSFFEETMTPLEVPPPYPKKETRKWPRGSQCASHWHVFPLWQTRNTREASQHKTILPFLPEWDCSNAWNKCNKKTGRL